MKLPRNAQIVLLAVLVFGLGVGVSLKMHRKAADQTAAETPAPEVAANPTGEVTFEPAQPMPTTNPGEIVPNAPEMPVPAGQPPEAAADEMQGDDVMEHHDHAAMMKEEAAKEEASPTPAELPVAGVQAGGAFSLTDHTGKAVTEKSWPGKYKLVFFGYTSCPDICPATLQKISAVMESYDPQGAKLQPLFITTDPARDTAELMATYVGGYDKSIVGLTGTKAQLADAWKAYKVYAADAGEGKVDHSSFIYLMSPDDRMLGIFSAKLTAEEMIAKIKEKTEAAP